MLKLFFLRSTKTSKVGIVFSGENQLQTEARELTLQFPLINPTVIFM